MPLPREESVSLVDLDASLRKLMDEFDLSAHLIEGSFAAIDPDLEARAVMMRPLVQGAGDAIFRFLEALEKTPEYRSQKKGRNDV